MTNSADNFFDRLKIAHMYNGGQPRTKKRYIYVGTDGKVYQGTDGTVYVSKRKGVTQNG